MKVTRLIAGAMLLCIAPVLARPADPAGSQNPPAASTQSTPAAPQTLPATGTSTQEGPGAAPLRVMVCKSLLINTTERLKRVSVTDPSVADALVVTPTQVLV